MRHFFLIVFLASTAFDCSTNSKLKKPRFPDDPKLISSWETFRLAVNKSDTTTLMSISHSCIMCSLCSSGDDGRIIPMEQFYHNQFPIVFDKALLSSMNDSSKVWAVYDSSSTYIERDSCLAIKVSTVKKLADVFVNIGTHDGEGSFVVIHFSKYDSSYKFYGMSMMP